MSTSPSSQKRESPLPEAKPLLTHPTHLWSAYCMPGMVPGSEDIQGSKSQQESQALSKELSQTNSTADAGATPWSLGWNLALPSTGCVAWGQFLLLWVLPFAYL